MADGDDHALHMAKLRETAPADVAECVDLMFDHGFRVVSARDDGMGRLLEFSDARFVARVVVDRCQWMFEVKDRGWAEAVDLDTIVDAMNGVTSWKSRIRHYERRDRVRRLFGRAPYLADQLPEGVEWVDAVPAALEWLVQQPDAEQVLAQLQRRRADEMWGPLPEG